MDRDVWLGVNVGGIAMKNPVMAASGTFGYGMDYPGDVLDSLGAVVVKGTTLKPRRGNPPPRIWETPAGLLNSIGLQNPGVDVFLEEHLPCLASKGAVVICNIVGDTEEDYGEIAARLDGAPGLAGIEVNVSCPNVRNGGLLFGQDPRALAKVMQRVRARTRLPVLVKLPPGDNIALSARVAQEEGADGLSVINSVPAMAIDVREKRPALGAVMGGLTGPAIKPIALRMVWICADAVSIPIVGMGGILGWEDAVEFMLAGATAVAVGSALFRDPETPRKVVTGIRDYLQEERMDSIEKVVGRAKGSPGPCAGRRRAG
ncbi:MAG: dihydroorotate dehydrogenase [Bacillota bacterium]